MISIGPDPERQRAMAEMLMSGMKPIRHWSDGLSNAGNSLAAALLGNRAEEGEARQDEERRRLMAEALGAMQGRPEETIQWNQPDASGSTTTTIPGREPDMQQAMAILLSNPDAGLEDLGLRFGLMGMEQEQRQADIARQNQWREEDRQWAMEDRAADQAFHRDMQRTELAAKQPQGTFAGNAMDAQAHNIVLSTDPSSPEYAAAYTYLSQPKTVFQDGQMVTITRDMSWAAAPSDTRTGGRPSLTAGAAPLTGGTPQAPLASGGMSQAPGAQPAYFASGQQGPQQTAAQSPVGQQIAPGVTVTPLPGQGDELTVAQEAVDKEFGKEYARLMMGGIMDVEKNLAQVRDTLGRLQSGEDLTGGAFRAFVPGFVERPLRSQFDPEGLAVQEQFEEVVQRNLREVLGAQFTEREGERLIARAYNPALSEAENAARVTRLFQALEGAYNAKIAAMQYYEQNGTLRGFTGNPNPTMRDIEIAARLDDEQIAAPSAEAGQMGRGEAPAAATPSTGQVPPGVDPRDWEWMTPEERALFQ